MVRKKYLVLILPILLLTSCNNNKVLRSDIEKFIASFSIDEALSTYLCAGYESNYESSYNGVVTTKTESMDFDVRDKENISYSYSFLKKENDEVVSQTISSITTENGKYIYTHNSDVSELTFEEVNNLIINFFYTSFELNVHQGGHYYGDLIIEKAYSYQDFTTIDEENSLYILDYQITNPNSSLKQLVKVNNIGMLVYEYVEVTNKGDYSRQTISVYNN